MGSEVSSDKKDGRRRVATGEKACHGRVSEQMIAERIVHGGKQEDALGLGCMQRAAINNAA